MLSSSCAPHGRLCNFAPSTAFASMLGNSASAKGLCTPISGTMQSTASRCQRHVKPLFLGGQSHLLRPAQAVPYWALNGVGLSMLIPTAQVWCSAAYNLIIGELPCRAAACACGCLGCGNVSGVSGP